jgi:NADH:ubiquinone oxidoreductase subunit C
MEIIDYTNIKADNQKALDTIDRKVKGAGIEVDMELVFDQVNALTNAKNIVALCRLLKEDRDLSFEYIRSITGSDLEDRYEIVYSLYSFAYNWSINVKVVLDYARPEVDSIVGIYKGADWFEREIWEMLGIEIKGHPDLRPLLLVGDEDFHPLKKSFEIKWEEREYIPTKKFE